MKQIKDVTIHCVGIKKKCRKVGHHHFTLEFDSLPENLLEIAKEKLLKEMKTISTPKCRINLRDVTLTGDGEFAIKTMNMLPYQSIDFTI